MKKMISIIMSICMVITGLPMMVYAMDSTPEISLEEFTKQLQEMQAEYDGDYASEITIENDSEFYHVDGEAYPVSDDLDTVATVTENDFEIPLSAIEPYCELPETSTYSLNNENYNDVTVDKETAEVLGFEVDIEDDRAVLTQPYQTERLIVKSKYDINPLDSVAIVEGYNDLHIVQFDNQESAKQAEEYYNKQTLIEYAEPDIAVSADEYDEVEATAADDDMGINYGHHLSWGSEAIGVDDYIDYMPSLEELPEIVVGIIDTGIDYDHEFLADRVIRTNYNVSYSGNENDENDDKGHGTHVAGIVVDNSTSNVKVKGYKVLDSEGVGTLSTVALAVEYAAADGVNVINMSLGTKGTSKTMENAVNAAVDSGITVCVSAGNNGQNASKNCPANIEACITVAAMGKEGNNYLRPYWTSWGELVDLAAPGMSVYSTYMNNEYETLSGTSMSCPFVAAASALLLSVNPQWNSEEVCTTLEDNAIFLKNEHEEFNFLYIGTITEYNKDRTAAPEFTVESGRYSDSVTIEIVCSDPDAEIYYTLDGYRASKSNGILYTGPIVIDKVTRVHACAYSGDKLKSLQSIANYYITVTDPDENFVIDTNGIITEYNGTNRYLTIPDTIGGITVTGIGKSVFYASDIVMVKFPDTLTYVGQSAFYNCQSLSAVYANNLKTVDKRGFYTCQNIDTIDLTQLEDVGEYGFGHCHSIPEVYNDKLTKINKGSFLCLSNAIAANFPNVTSIDIWGLRDLQCAEYVNLPKVQSLGQSALADAYVLENLDLPELTTLEGDSCFASTYNLKEFNAPKLKNLTERAFYGSYIEYLDLPSVTEIASNSFRYCDVKTLKLDSLTAVNKEVFSNLLDLETLYIPSVEFLYEGAFKNISDSYNSGETVKVFAPSLVSLDALPENTNDVVLYATDKLQSITITTDNKYSIIAPLNSYAQQWANENGHTFIPSDYRDDNVENPANVTDLGRSICCSAAGLRFGFTWDNIDEIESLASDIEYGFVYSQKGAEDLSVDTVDGSIVKSVIANNRIDHGDTTSFNLVISNIPKSYYGREITARAYVCIDGMYFYSNMMKGSFGGVAELVLADNEIDVNTKNAINNLLSKEV